MSFEEYLKAIKNKVYNKVATDDALESRKYLRGLGKDPKLDLLQHYHGSKNLSKIAPGFAGKAAVLGLGLGKEIVNSVNQSSNAGFSMDDMGANLMGVLGIPLDVASSQNIFNHTETADNIKGYGQGDIRKVANKFNIFDIYDELMGR